jgi:cytidylate kinase
VICPDAQVKLYVVAADEVRAERRWRELSGKGVRVTKAEVLADLRERDARDSARATAPLRPAADAVILDTTTMSIEAAVAAAIAAVEAKRSGA